MCLMAWPLSVNRPEGFVIIEKGGEYYQKKGVCRLVSLTKALGTFL
jgi:hypothetical protein